MTTRGSVDRGRPPAGVVVAVVLLAFAAPLAAQESSQPIDHPVVLVGAQFGAPTRLSGSAGVLIAPPKRFTPQASPDSSRAGLVVKGTAGMGGFSVAAGAAALALEGPYLTTGFDALVTVTRTGQTPRAAGVHSTYVGVEGGLVIMSVRLSAGVAHRATGPPGSNATIFTWSAGVQIPLGW
jgi:hypothetical protein